MSLKAVELQIALPKTFDAGKIVDQHQQHTINQQLHANEQLKREIERKQLTVNHTEQMDAITDEDGHTTQQQMTCKKEQQEQEKKKSAQHPFKGNFIDFSG